jgi:hypothetical protein
MAYAGHIFCDAVTGGVALFYPFSKTVTGRNFLPYMLWKDESMWSAMGVSDNKKSVTFLLICHFFG